MKLIISGYMDEPTKMAFNKKLEDYAAMDNVDLFTNKSLELHITSKNNMASNFEVKCDDEDLKRQVHDIFRRHQDLY